LPHQKKTELCRARCPCAEILMNKPGPLLMGRLTYCSHINRHEMTFEYTRYTLCQGSWLWYWSLSGGCKSRERLTINKQTAQNLEVERFKLRKVNELDFWKQYQMKTSNRLAALENIN